MADCKRGLDVIKNALDPIIASPSLLKKLIDLLLNSSEEEQKFYKL